MLSRHAGKAGRMETWLPSLPVEPQGKGWGDSGGTGEDAPHIPPGDAPSKEQQGLEGKVLRLLHEEGSENMKKLL